MNAPVDVLMVDDSPEDIRLVEEALRGGELPVRLHAVSDGQEALAFLERRPPYAGVPRPRLMLLDLNLPRVDGREVLSALKGDPRLRGIPVVVLSTTASPDDVLRAYSSYANCFVTKPRDLHRFFEVIRTTVHFWLRIATLPSGG